MIRWTPNMKLSTLLVIWMGIGLLLNGGLLGQKADAFSLFDSDSVVNVVLESDFKNLVKHKFKEEYQPANITVYTASGDTVHHDIKIKSRGNRRKEVCYNPPIFVKFKKDNYAHSKLKLVIPCRYNPAYDQILLREYLCYKMYEQLTDRALRTALMRIDFIDSGRDGKVNSGFAFAIEDIDQLAERFGGREYDPISLREKVLDKDQLAMYVFFQYLIANTDWHVSNSHNIKAITHPDNSAIYVIPYDFDYSGFVDTEYAVPHETVPVKDVTDRYNKGSCLTEERCEEMRVLFMEKKDDILNVVKEDPYLNSKEKKQCLSYLEAFFTEMESTKKAKSVFVVNCRNQQKS